MTFINKIVEIITIGCLLFILIASIMTIVGTFKMHEAIVRGKAMHEKCGTEYYEAETVRYQVYDKWETECKKLFNMSGIFTIIVINVVLAIYICVVWMDTKKVLKATVFYTMIAILITALCLLSTIGTGLLEPESSIKPYANVEDELSIPTRIIGSLVMIIFIVVLPLLVPIPESWRQSNQNYSSIFGNQENGTIYRTGWVLIRIVVIVAIVNLIFSLSIRKGIHTNYYNPTEPNQLATGKLNELIKQNIGAIKGASYASEKGAVDTQPIYSSSNYALYKSIYRGINDIEKPENGVDEGSLKNTASDIYQPYFKYLKHSKDTNELLSLFNTTDNDYTTLFTGLVSADKKVSEPINTLFITTMLIISALVIVPIFAYFHSQYKSETNKNFLIKVGAFILLLLLFSFLYVIMTQSLIS